ncbi:MAG: hypothetical protein N4A68_11620 [Maledivibacter sp.]|jgi:hypothetical protein|nr:hypothetical protein [Maledivibacter sp.]
MAVLKTSLRIVFLILLCLPIAYIQFYIVKSTADEVMNSDKKKSSKSDGKQNDYYTKEYLKIAK